MQEEILSLKLRVSEQEEVLKGTIQRLRSTSRTKENMEHFIVNQCKCFSVCVKERAGEIKRDAKPWVLVAQTDKDHFRAVWCMAM